MRDKIRITPSCFPANPVPKHGNLANELRSMAKAMSEKVEYEGLSKPDQDWIHNHLRYCAETILMHFDLVSDKRMVELEEEAVREANRTLEIDPHVFREAPGA